MTCDTATNTVPDVICFQETNLKGEDMDTLKGVPENWYIAVNEHPVGHMHGAGIMTGHGSFFRERDHIFKIYDFSDNKMDILAVRVRMVTFISVYIHCVKAGNGNMMDILDQLIIKLGEIKAVVNQDEPVIMMGDFNAPQYVEYLMDLMMETFGLQPVLPEGDKPKATHEMGGILDWIFYRLPLQPSRHLIIEDQGQDHAVLRCSFNIPCAKNKDEIRPTRLNYSKLKKMDDEQFKIMEKEMEEAIDGAESLDDFYIDYLRIAQKHLGKARPRIRRLPKEWFSKQVRDLKHIFKQKARQHNRQRTAKSKQEKTESYKAYRKAIRKEKRRVERGEGQDIQHGKKSIWRMVPSKKGAAHQSKIVSEPEPTLEFWRDFMFDDDPLTEEDIAAMETGDHADDDELIFTVDELDKAIDQEIKTNKAPGDDDVRPVLLKKLKSMEFRTNLTRLYNHLANKRGPLPAWMRRGLGRLIYKKKGARKDPNNYRLIILAPLLAKIYEKLLEMKGRQMIQDGPLKIAVEQGGFMAKRSTHDSVFLLESIRDAQIKAHKHLYATFLDLRKAFDTVNHKKLLTLLRQQGAKESWVRAVQKVLTNREMSLFDEFLAILKGTPQGSPISPQLFILFINPLIEKLRKCTGIRIARDQHYTRVDEVFIRGLFFADDICLVNASLHDLQDMLRICEAWAQEAGMSFNLEKCEIMQLAGKIPKDRPIIEFAGGTITWVKEFKYLGIPIHEGRRRRLPAPRPKMWKAYFRILPGLSSKKGLPLLRQIQLMQATIMNAALYASPVRDLDYADIDRFTTRVLAQISGCNMRTTSATFLRAELGVLPSKFMAHTRALVQLWHIIHEAWFRNLLPHLCGLGPYERLLKIAQEYNIDTGLLRSMTRDKWKDHVKQIIKGAAEKHMAAELEARGLPKPEQQTESRIYVRIGGSRAQYGIQYRWALLRDNHPKLGNIKDITRADDDDGDDDGLPVFLAPVPKEHGYYHCTTCRRWHRPYATNIVEAMRCPILTPQVARKRRHEAIMKIIQESRLPIQEHEALPSWFYEQVDNISWPGQTAESIDMLLQTFQRIIQHYKRQERDRGRMQAQANSQ